MQSNEVYGEGALYTALFWEYDARIGVRWNMDPKLIVGESPYLCFGDNPIRFNDILGDVRGNTSTKGAKRTIQVLEGRYPTLNDALLASNNFDYQKMFEHATKTTNYYKLAIGVAGEAEFFDMLVNYLDNIDPTQAMYTHQVHFNPNQTSNSKDLWDVKETFWRHGNPYSSNKMSEKNLIFNNVDGTPGPWLELPTDDFAFMAIYYQVKTVTVNDWTITNIVGGFKNAIATAETHPKAISVLAVDQEAYEKAFFSATPAQQATVQELYKELSETGRGYLLLVPGLTRGAQRTLNDASDCIDYSIKNQE